VGGAGDVMAKGAFGIGGAAPSSMVDIDDTGLPPGFYGYDLETLGDTPSLAGSCIITKRGTRTVQLASAESSADPDVFVRAFNAGWGSWSRLYADHNTVGTVSQSGGVPTGAIFERGSNSNGNYIKFADGTLKTWQEVAHLDTAVDVAVGPIFRTPSFDCPPYPHAFVARPIIATDYRATNGVDFWGSSAGLGSATQAFYSYRFFNSRITPAAQLIVCISATGRWY
jgi:hypothetical protein